MKKIFIFIIFIIIIFMIAGCEYFRQLTEEELLDIAGVEDSLGLVIINPVDGMTVAGTKTVTAVVTASTVSKVEFYIDGFYLTEDIESPYEYSWNTTSGIDGAHSIRVRAFDNFNNIEEKKISVTVNNSGGIDTTAPSTGISFPANGSNIIGNTLFISNCTDASGINRVYIYINDNYYSSLTSGTGRLWLNTGNYSNGSKTIMIRAFDNAGNMGTASITAAVSNVNNDKNYMQSAPGGTFTIGWTGLSNNTASVTVSSYYMGKYEITQGLWNTVYTWAITHGYVFNSDLSVYPFPFGSTKLNYPVSIIRWYNSLKFCNALSEMYGLTPCYYTDIGHTIVYRTGNVDIDNTMVNWNTNGYRLPTEAEWEYAARYIDGSTWRDGDKFSGSDSIDDVCWYKENSGYTQQTVGTKSPNQLIIYDMSGNQWEWCWDWFTDNYTAGTDPLGPSSGSGRIRRGGFIGNSVPTLINCFYNSSRFYSAPSIEDGAFAFRVVRKP